MIQSVGIIVMAAFILLSWGAFRKLVLKQTTVAEKLVLILFFGAFGVLGTYMGTPIMGAIANLRAIGVITAGLFGGPIVGIGAGLIAGGHRLLIDPGGFTSLPCALSTFLEAVAAGLLSLYLKERVLNWRVGVSIAVVGETIHMLIVLALARPFAEAWALIKVISLPMIGVNSLGIGLFVEIVRYVLRDREKRASSQAQKSLDIANQTVSHLRQGLNLKSANATAQIIFNHLTVAAVSITNNKHILAHIGAGEDHHSVGHLVQTASIQKVIETGEPVHLKEKSLIGCRDGQCPLQSSIVVPLKKNGNIMGTLALFGDAGVSLHEVDFQMARGLAELFSTQLELEDIQLKDQLLARAEIMRLQAQINPHFLFNSLNTVVSFCRSSPEKARQLLLELANYMRRNLRDNKCFVEVAEELNHVQSYLSIEQARFGERIKVSWEIEPGCESWPVPALIIQPLVENAVKHGLSSREEGGNICIAISRDNGDLQVRVEDDGVGMQPQAVEGIFNKGRAESCERGVGLSNVNQRLEQIYGPQYGLMINSAVGSKTVVSLRMPRKSYLM